ncbi:MAG: zinc-ribbon domain-containing protein [Muribaculaceae bacterium]|nr:zinc-ribbon domain-containing protein [Muribaculaceae bacterium]
MKCISCYREIKDTVKFCNYCGTKQPADRAAYELEHPELADALPEEEVKKILEEQERERQEQERLRQELEEQQRQEEQRRLEEQQRLEEQRRLEEQQWLEQQQQQEQVIDIPMDEVPEGYAQPVIPSESDIAPHVTPSASDGMSTELVTTSPRMAAPTKQCFECGQIIPATAHVCPYCGAPVQQSYGGNHTEITQMVPQGYQPPTPAPTQQPVINIQSGSSGGNNKKILIAIASVLAVGILGILGYFLIQRNKATYINTDTKSLYFSRKGGDKTLNVSTDGTYFDVDAPKWLTATKTESGISFNCTALDGNDDRSGVIIIKSGSQSCHVDVVQRAYATFIRLSETTVSQGRDEGDHNITIESDGGDFQIATSPDYCTVSNLTDQGFTLHIDYNSGKHRDGTIKITDGKNEASLTVSQKGVCSSCGGKGRVNCSKCDGYGWGYYDDYWGYDGGTCPYCNGTGKKTCSKCGGSGIR